MAARIRVPRAKRRKPATPSPSASARVLVSKLRKAFSPSPKQAPRPPGQEGGMFYPAGPYPYPVPPGLAGQRGNSGPEGAHPEESISGVAIPAEAGRPARGGVVVSEKRAENLQEIDTYYSLVPRAPRKGERVFAYARIKWDPRSNQLVYFVIEPPISQEDVQIMEETKRRLEERLDIDFVKLGEIKARELLRQEIEGILRSQKMPLSPERIGTLVYHLERDIIGLGRLEPIMNDPNIEDISCDGAGIPIYVYHRDPAFGSMVTTVSFTSHAELNSFVVKLAQRCRKTISIAQPLLDASLPDGSRIQATLGTDIARKGSNFTIRKFAEDPLTPTHMMKYGTMGPMQMAYLWLAIENGQSILISGGTATGKTSMLNALSLFIRPSLKIVSIEDTPELRLPHPHWIPEVARSALSEEGSRGDVSLFDLLKSSLRQRPDYIVMGEVRGREAFVLFQQMATGHPSLATIHAASMEQLVDRLTTPPISLPPTLLENINIVVFLTLTRLRGSYVRRMGTITEIAGVRDGKPVPNNVFVWEPATDSFASPGQSVVLKSLARKLGITEDSIKDELLRRKTVLEWMLENGVEDYREVARLVSTYYTDPESVIDMVGS
jgi:flagellar protein FlaI